MEGKCKIEFEKWVSDRFYQQHRHEPYIDTIKYFKALDFSMQWGVYLEFFDSVGIYIQEDVFSYSPATWNIKIMWHEPNIGKSLFSHKENDKLLWCPFDSELELGCYVFKSRKEAQQEALKKAVEIYNTLTPNN